MPITVSAGALGFGAYREYGDIVAARSDVKSAAANMGTARRFDRLAGLVNLREGKAQANLCVYRCEPVSAPPITLKVLERHEHSTQVFIPMGRAGRFLVVVCRGADAPDLATLRAFIADGRQGITYRPGVWHHPMLALDAETDFACLVYEDGTAGDCEVRDLSEPIVVTV